MELLKYIAGNSDFDIDFNAVNQSGNTPLHFACCLGRCEVVKFLFEDHEARGIDVNKKNDLHMTCITLPSKMGIKMLSSC